MTGINTAAGRIGSSRERISSMRSVPWSPLTGIRLGSVRLAGISKSKRARARAKNSAELIAAGSFFVIASLKLFPPHLLPTPHRKERPGRPPPEHRDTIDHPLLAHVNQIIVQCARDLRPKVGSDMQIRRQSTFGGRLKP